MSKGANFRIVLTTGIHYFQCNNCGLCCEGPVELTTRDYERIMRLAEKLGKEPIIEVKQGPHRLRRIMKPIQKDELLQECAFLIYDGPRRLCSIYSDRPCYCRLYPVFLGVSHVLGELYADVLHCPGVTHREQSGYMKLDEKTILEIVREIVEFDNEFINIIPNMDRGVVLSLYSKFRELYIMWPLKYQLVQQLNNILMREVEHCENFLQLLYEIARFQTKLNNTLRECYDVFKLAQDVEKYREKIHVRLDDVWKMVFDCLKQAEMVVDKDVVILDNYYKEVYGVELNVKDLRELELDSVDIEFIGEIFRRFSCNFQTCALPLEFMYVKGYAILLLLYCLYRNTCEDIVASLYNFDAVGLAIYTRYVNKLLSTLGLGYITIGVGARFGTA